jgi:Acyl-CoA dehydrogenase, C-terminal domain
MSTTALTDDVLDMLRDSLRHVLTETSNVPFGDRLAVLGWDEVVADDASTALRTLFEIKGETVSSADALTPTLARHLAKLTGDPALVGATVALPSPYGASTCDGDMLRVDAVVLSPLAATLVIAVDDRLAMVPAEGLSTTPMQGTDETLGLTRVSGTASGCTWIDGATWTQLETHARWLLACELVGISRHVVGAAVEYTKVRVQYGKPIGVFQALQHRLASAHVAVVGAGHVAAEAGVSGDAWVALVAKCVAGRAAEDACTQAQQCYGAIGFTWEHEFHRYLRRTYVLDQLLGNWRMLENEIGTRLQESGVVPRIGTL